MGKKILINLNNVHIEGDILDVSRENSGIIYNISKDAEEEVSVDYVDLDSRKILNRRTYDACTFFFNLNNILGGRKKESLIKEICGYLKEEGVIYIWDINKERGGFCDYNVNAVLPNGSVKEVVLKNYNPLITCKFEEIKKILEKYSEIEETKLWEDIFFIKAVKKKKLT
ncbi:MULTISPECIES: hypothetical protein [Clostridium]|uniref:Class I SAM-dependent methyltransferase n=1 Tax=Clostridium cibarium TaxID=2762247 RepID=A0ABR8PP34_9CLOT|nr:MULTISPECIES: hypothetical protein [Clostridium]MBD7909949.1 hypothetical protein [Clostridium cibarium]